MTRDPNTLGAKHSPATIFQKSLRDLWFVFKNHVDATLLPIHLQIPLRGILSEYSALLELSSGATTLFPCQTLGPSP
jgi:hypothetical protein